MNIQQRSISVYSPVIFLFMVVFSFYGCASEEVEEETTTDYIALASWAQKIALGSSGDFYVTGFAYGTDIAADIGTSEADIFLAKFNKSTEGEIIWLKQIDRDGDDFVQDLFVSPAGDIYLAGYTDGSLESDTGNVGGYDIFVMKYDATGNQIWVRQIGTGSDDFCRGIVVDASNNIFIVGNTSGVLPGADQTNTQGIDLFVMKLDGTNNEVVWTKQIGTDNLISAHTYSKSYGVAIALNSSGTLFVGGLTNDTLGSSRLGGNDLILAKYDASTGTQAWISQFGSSGEDTLKRIKISNSGDFYVTGYTDGIIADATRDSTEYELSANYSEVFLYKFKSDTTGDADWIKQTGSSISDWGNDLAIDSSENVYLVGNTNGAVTGDNTGATDFFIQKYDASGDLLWNTQNGSNLSDSADGIMLDANDDIYITGRTFGTLDSKTNAEQAFEVFVSQYNDSTSDPSWTIVFGED